MAKPNLPVKTKTAGKQVSLPAEWRKELSEAAKAVTAKETPSSSVLSFKSGQMTWQGNQVPGNKMACVILNSCYERAYYDQPFDPNVVRSPVCFALAESKEDVVAPHDNSPDKQSDTCGTCKKNEWGSAGGGRGGKACKEIRRLAFIPTDRLETVQDITNAEVCTAKIPITSVNNWANHVYALKAMFDVPPWAAITEMSVVPHIKNQFEVKFAILDNIEDTDALGALKSKAANVLPLLLAPYSTSTDNGEEAPPPPPAKTKRKF